MEMHDKMRDSMHFLYNQDDCTFSKLLKNAMMAEAESKARTTVKSKSANVDVPTNSTDENFTSIQSQLDSMSKILKSAQFSKNSKKSNNGSKKGGGENQLKLNRSPNPGGQPFQQLGPTQGLNLQSSATGAWVGDITSVTAQTGNPSRAEWSGETCMGRRLWRVHAFPR